MSKINIKNMFKREYRPIILCGIVLIILTGALIAVIFYDRDSALKVPETPQYEKLEVGFVDFDDAGTDPNSLQKSAAKELSVDYDVVTDYYKNDILLSNTQVEYLNDLFIVHSGKYPHGTFVSAVTKDGELKWLTKLEEKDYTDIEINKVIYFNDFYYVFADAKHKGDPESVGFVIDGNGKKIIFNKLITDAKDDIYDVFVDDSGNIIILYDGINGIQLFLFDEFLNYENKYYWMFESDSNIFFDSRPEILTASYNDHKVYMTVRYSYNEETIYNYIVDTETLKDTISKAKEMDNFNNLKDGIIVSNTNGRYLALDKVVYKFGLSSSIENRNDYSKLELEDKSNHSEAVPEDDKIDNIENLNNEYSIENITLNDELVIVKGSTAFNNIYDIYDKNLKLTKRFMISNYMYDYDNEIFLKMFFIDGKIYEIYSHGTETPSLMISTIG